MLVEEFFVHFIIMNMVLNAVFRIATITRLLELRHASNIRNNGLIIAQSIVGIL
jgi:hypothetical protein